MRLVSQERWIAGFAGQVLAGLLCLALLSTCAPPGARNWPSSIGPRTYDLLGTNSIALGDLDSDGHLDAFFGNATSYMDQTENIIRNQPNTV